MRATNVVLGAGAMGLATAYHLAKRGEPVTLIEQFAIGHDRGSSHGAARIIRHSYADEFYAQLMPRAFAAWRELEADCGETLYVRTGGVSLCPPAVDYVDRVAAGLKSLDVAHRRMSGRILNARWPIFSVPEDHDCVLEPDAGMLLADRALRAMLRLITAADGAVVREQTPVARVELDSARPRLTLDGESIEADRLIVTAGPWIGSLFPELRPKLQPERQQVLYFSPGEPEAFSIGRMPIFISVGKGPRDLYYGMPSVLGSGTKVARHGGAPIEADFDDRLVSDAYRKEIREFLAGCMPSLADSEISRTEICKYTVAANEDFLVGRHPNHPRVIIASPCSGHGFKFACLIGRILADIACEGTTDLDIAHWNLDK